MTTTSPQVPETAAFNPRINPRKARIYKAAMQLFSEHGDPEANVSELASIAGVARGTIYNNIGDLGTLFSDVSGHVTAEMGTRLALALDRVAEPERRLAMAIRVFIRRSHEEPYWGKFMMRYALSNPSFEALLIGLPLHDVVHGLEAGRYTFRPEQLASVLAMVGGTVLSAMRMVQEGHKTWRDAGTDAAELVLRAMGVPASEAQAIAAAELPVLPVLE
ncbi:MAG: TetR/AcrR family transcriptional regulator [Pseudomonadota bacterium]